MGTYGHLWDLWGPIGGCGDLCVTMGAYGDLWTLYVIALDLTRQHGPHL